MEFRNAAHAYQIAQKLMVYLTLKSVSYARFTTDKQSDIEYKERIKQRQPKYWQKWVDYLEAHNEYKKLKREEKNEQH